MPLPLLLSCRSNPPSVKQNELGNFEISKDSFKRQTLNNFTRIGPQSRRRSKMEEVSLRRRRTLFSRLSATDPAKITPPEIPGGRATLLNFIQEEEAAAGIPPEREQGQPIRVSQMTLLAVGEKLQVDESPAADEEEVAEEKMLCSVCNARRKGAAFIPCGHTFCRLCSRVLVTGRRSCPVCNEAILDVLDIF